MTEVTDQMFGSWFLLTSKFQVETFFEVSSLFIYLLLNWLDVKYYHIKNQIVFQFYYF